MPKVGNKHFSYSAKGKAAAKKYAKKTGKPISKMAMKNGGSASKKKVPVISIGIGMAEITKKKKKKK